MIKTLKEKAMYNHMFDYIRAKINGEWIISDCFRKTKSGIDIYNKKLRKYFPALTCESYTGYGDSNSQPIFEGQLVFVDDEDVYTSSGVGEVKFKNGTWVVVLRDCDSSAFLGNELHHITRHGKITVVGDVHDNPSIDIDRFMDVALRCPWTEIETLSGARELLLHVDDRLKDLKIRNDVTSGKMSIVDLIKDKPLSIDIRLELPYIRNLFYGKDGAEISAYLRSYNNE